MLNLCAKCDVCNSTRYEDRKGDAKCRKWGGWSSYGSLKVIGIVLLRDIGQKSPILICLACIWLPPVGVTQLNFIKSLAAND